MALLSETLICFTVIGGAITASLPKRLENICLARPGRVAALACSSFSWEAGHDHANYAHPYGLDLMP